MRVAGYTRVSRAEQARLGHSLFAQDDVIKQFARQRGWELTRIYQDAGISGRRTDRPALKQLLADAEAGLFDVVVVHSVDRFFRNLQGLLKALNYLQRHNVSFISITENIDFTTPWGKLTLAVLGTLAEIYIDKLSEETKKGKRARAQKGLYNGSPPLGYCKGNCSSCTDLNGKGYCPRFGGPDLCRENPSLPLHPHPVEHRAVQLAYEWYATGNYSDGQIAERLNDYRLDLPDGSTALLRSKGRPGLSRPAPFSKDTVRELLQRILYTGMVPYLASTRLRSLRRQPTAIFSGQHPALIDQDLYDRCQKVRHLMNNHPRRHPEYAQRLYLLSGILRCDHCKRKMRAQSGHGVRFYQDTTRLQHDGQCDQPMVNADEIERQVVELVLNFQLPADWREQALTWDLSPEEAQGVLQKREEIEQQMARLRQLYVLGDIDLGLYESEKTRLHTQLADLTNPHYSSIIAACSEVETLSARWGALTDLQKKDALRLTFAGVLIQGHIIVSVQPSQAVYPFFRQWASNSGGIHCRKSGSDGR